MMQAGKNNPSYKHGHTTGKFSPTYYSWTTMHQRCSNPSRPYYANYGGRGISVCERWRLFENFLADMGARPEGKTLDRIDNDGPYSPENCRWATNTEQAANTSQTKFVTLRGETKSLTEWCSVLGMSINTVRCRVKRYGFTYEEALLRPIQTKETRLALCRNMVAMRQAKSIGSRNVNNATTL